MKSDIRAYGNSLKICLQYRETETAYKVNTGAFTI